MEWERLTADYYKPKGCPVHGVTLLNDSNVKVPKLGIKSDAYKGIAETNDAKKPINKELFGYTNSLLLKGIEQVYGKPKYSDKEFEFVLGLQRNVSKFAGYKTAHQTALLTKAKPEAYSAINNAYNTNYARSEFVHTVRSARMAKNWQQWQADKDIYPYLEYIPSVAAEPRSDHKKLYGIIKHLDDDFWDTWLPPSDWGCKCSTEQRRKNTGSRELPTDLQKPSELMRNNAGKSGAIFTDAHPMIKAVSKELKEVIDKEYQHLERKQIRNELLSSNIPKQVNEIKISKTGIKKVMNDCEINEWYILQDLEYLLNKLGEKTTRKPNKEKRTNIRYSHFYRLKTKKELYALIWESNAGEQLFHSIVYSIEGDTI